MFDQEQKFQKPIFNTKFKATFEEIVRNAFNVNICMILNEVITDCEFAMRGVQGTGSPDFTCHKKDDDKLIMAIEIKRYHILLGIKPDQTLPEFYKEDAKARMVIQQIYNYLSENQLKYGALSTYDNNWFVKREHKRLYISKSPSLDSTRPPILKSYAYLARLAKRDHYSLHPSIIPQIDDSQYNLRKRSHDDSDDDRYDSNSNPQLSRSQRSSFNRSSSGTSGSQQSSSKQSASKQSSSNTSGKQNMKAQNFNYGDFKYNSILSAGENKKVLECEFHGQTIVLKCTDLSKKPNCLDELLNEVKIYKSLAKLQGIYIPELLFYGDLANGMSFVMGMSMVGTTLSHHKIDKRQKKRALGALDKIHDYKILHKDIREENILIDKKGYVYLTDFGMSIRNDDEELFSKEKFKLSRLLDCYM